MEEYKVLITTSGLGSRLGNLTDYTNKCLIRIADKPAISYIVESYPEDTKFVITLGHYGSHVKQFLRLAYPNHNFTFVEVDKYKGEGSSLGYSILQCKHEINCPFIFHASDTIVKDFKIPSLDNNWIVGNYKEDSSQYRTLNLSDGKLIKINEKGELGHYFSYIGLTGIKDFELFFYNLEKLVYGDYEDISDVHVINNMLSEVDFYYKEVNYGNWFDIGNTSELVKTRKKFSSSIDVLDKKDESIFFFDKFVIKFFYDKNINRNRVIRAKNLKSLVPKIIDSTENFYKYEKAEGKLFSKSVNKQKFLNFLDWSKQNLWISKFDLNFEKKCYDFYITKTKNRISQYLNSSIDEEDIINGERIPSIYYLLDKIDKNWICDGKPSQFHGDFILDNIIETKEGFTLIDWRQDFAGDLEVGDLYYDLAKLNHNLVINHDIVNKNLFDSSKDNCYILINSRLNECKGVLHSFIKDNKYDLKKVKILTAIIWINMAPLHEYPFNNFLFNFGKYNLYKNLML
jgi:NDP-sugar pyrophosphorylase family protein